MPENTILVAAVTILTILISMTLHEAMHAYAGFWLGDDTAKLEGRLSLNPLTHIDPFLTVLLPVVLVLIGAPVFGAAKPVPFNPYRVRYGEFGAALVGLAGPAVNLLLAVAVAGIFKILTPEFGSLPFSFALTIQAASYLHFDKDKAPSGALCTRLSVSRVLLGACPDLFILPKQQVQLPIIRLLLVRLL